MNKHKFLIIKLAIILIFAIGMYFWVSSMIGTPLPPAPKVSFEKTK
ncbi:MAG: hypothetical protein ACOYMB_05285 [Patescibacteria group bacterium]